MKRNIKKLVCILLASSIIIANTISVTSIDTLSAKASETFSDETMQGAILLEADKESTCLFEGKANSEAHYFKFIAPGNAQSQWFSFTVTNYANKNMYAYLLDSNGEVLVKSKNSIGTQKEWSSTARTYGTGTTLTNTVFLTPGNVYYIKVQQALSTAKTTGTVSVSVKTTSDDNWGTYDKASQITLNNWQNGIIEKSDDIDFFYVTLPNDNHTYSFNITTDSSIKVSLSDENRSNLGSTSVSSASSNCKLSQIGQGQKIYIKIQGNTNTINANYSIKVFSSQPVSTPDTTPIPSTTQKPSTTSKPNITSEPSSVSDETMQGAILLEANKESTCLFEEKANSEAHYFKFIAPDNAQSQWFSFTVTNYTNKSMYAYLLDSNGEVLVKSKNSIGTQKEWSSTARTYGTGTTLGNTVFLTTGNTYYIKVQQTHSSAKTTGTVSVSVKTTSDDNWGTYDKASQITLNNWQNGIIEKSDDIDIFYVTLPNDNHTYSFNIASDNPVNATFTDENRSNLGKVSITANNSNNSFTQTGHGQIIYIKIQTNDANTTSANYSIKVNEIKENTEKSTIRILSLNSYKKGSKKITGKTISNATVKITVPGYKYTVKSDNSGKFTIKLIKKLKAKQKIIVSVSKNNYITKKKSFIVK